MAVHRVLLEPHEVELGEELVGEAGLDEEPQTRGGVVDEQQLRQLVADALRADDLEPGAVLPTASTSASSGTRPNVAMKRAARSMRSGSSRNDTSGDSGVRRRLFIRSTAPPYGSTSTPSGRRNAIALIVKSRRDRSVSTSSA